MPNESLRISDVTFVVTSQIERAPHWTMIRELTMNAIEAAAQANGEKEVRWTTGVYKSYQKAVIWNTGPGMSAPQLKQATDLACTIDKTLGLDDNFGVGAKVSSLANNRFGMRFRSCKAGLVSEVILGYDPDERQYVRFERELADGRSDTVIDVTAVVSLDQQYDLSFDWTEVMLLGNSESQNTATHPFATESTDKNYVATTLYRRFYRLPVGVNVYLDSVYHRLDGKRRFVPIGQRYDKFVRFETVVDQETGLSIHYLHDPAINDRSGNRTSTSSALGSTTTTCCLIHKDEMYSVMTGNQWSAAAPRFGIPFGSKELCIHIELVEEEVRPTQYRERLISKRSGADILPEDYAIWVRECMPDWVKEVIRNASPRRTEDYSDLRKELQDLMNKYKIRVSERKIDPTDGKSSSQNTGENVGGLGTGGGEGGNTGGGGRRNGRRRFHEVPEGSTTTSLYEVYEQPPEIRMLLDHDDIVEKGLNGRAAEFIIETGDLFINGLYEAVDLTVEDVEPEFGGQADPELIRQLVLKEARWAMAFRVGKATVFALAKRANKHWDQISMAAALSKESLSISADNYHESLPVIRKRVRDEIKSKKFAA